MSCCYCGRRKPLNKDEIKKRNDEFDNTMDDITSDNNNDSINPAIKANIVNGIQNDSQKDNTNKKDNINYYFRRPIKNQFKEEELLKMNIIEINLGIHLTLIENSKNKSFHPFFFIKLNNPKKIGVIIQYIKLSKEEKKLTHLYEEDGVEYLEISNSDFIKEYTQRIKKISKSDLLVDDWLINYNSCELGNITLEQFFNKIIPKKGEWAQKKLNPKTHGCIHFTIESIKKLGIKKDEIEIKPIKERMRKVLDNIRLESTNDKKKILLYQKYEEAFNELFKVIKG